LEESPGDDAELRKSQSPKVTYCMISFILNIQKDNNLEMGNGLVTARGREGEVWEGDHKESL